MAYYYAIERSSEYLEHYGVKGMKWGVRKALARGDRAGLRRHYLKAAKKLGELSLNANRGIQQQRYAMAKRRMGAGVTQSALGSAALSAGLSLTKGLGKKNAVINAAIGAAGGALGGAILNSKGISAKHHISDRGHARAVEKRNQFAREMSNTFKGTLYGGKEQRKLQQQIMAISDQKDPQGYVHKQLKRAQSQHNKQMARVGYDRQTKTLYGDFRSNAKRNQVSTRQKLDQHAANLSGSPKKKKRH